MRSSAIFANRVMSVVSVSKMPAGLWPKLCSRVIEPILEDLSKNSRIVEIDGERCDAYLSHMPYGEARDAFAEKVSAEVALELYRTQREYNRIADNYEKALKKPPVETPEEIADRLTNGISQVDELNRFLVIADAFVEIADEFKTQDIDASFIKGLLTVTIDIFTHYMLLAPLDIDSEIKICGGMLQHCKEQCSKANEICSYLDGLTEPESEEPLEAAEEPSDDSGEQVSSELEDEPQEAVEEPVVPTEEPVEEATEPVEEEATEESAESEESEEIEDDAEGESEPETIESREAASEWAEPIEEPKTDHDDGFSFVNGPDEKKESAPDSETSESPTEDAGGIGYSSQ